MKKSSKIFWISFSIYSVLTFVSTLVIERNENNLGFLINMKGYIPLLKYYTLLGLVFFIIAFLLMWRTRVRNKKFFTHLEEENTSLKATLFDLQEKKETPPPTNGEGGDLIPEE